MDELANAVKVLATSGGDTSQGHNGLNHLIIVEGTMLLNMRCVEIGS